MAETNGGMSAQKWTSFQAYILASVCLLIGIAVGYLLHGSTGSTPAAPAPTAAEQPAAGQAAPGARQAVSPEQLKAMADKKAAPLLEQLKSKPGDATLLAEVGNLYYDAHAFPVAVGYYQKSLKSNPKNTAVRTDMATAMAYSGNIDQGIAEFTTVLKQNPNDMNALFNRGMVKWQGKMDIKGAMADWELLLKKDPGYPQAEKVRMFIEQAKKHMNMKPGETTNKPAM